MQPGVTAEHPILVLVRGMPGSGKSYLAQALQAAIGQGRTVLLDPDSIHYEGGAYQALSQSLDAEGLDRKIHPFRFLRGRAYDGILADKIIIWNQPFTNRGMFKRMVEKLQAYAAEYDKQLVVLVVKVVIDAATAKARVAERKRAGGHGPSDATLAERMRDYESFADDGYRTVTVSGAADVAKSVEAVLQALRNL